MQRALGMGGRGATVNAIVPGTIESPMDEGTFDAYTTNRSVRVQRRGGLHHGEDHLGEWRTDLIPLARQLRRAGAALNLSVFELYPTPPCQAR